MTTTTMTLQEFFTRAAEQAALIFRARGELLPMFHAVDGRGEHMLIPTPWENPKQKAETIQAVTEIFKGRGVTRYAFMAEAWSAEAKMAEGKKLSDVKPYIGHMQDYPDRREILAINAEDSDGQCVMGWYYILRPEHGPATLSPLHMSEATDYVGQLMGLLR